ncbi:dephospho-CoA kinase [Enterococcus asini ATCC 700915]|uniref:Dephospho-CoA kinase n=1 Tax=Enterococcus asini ATCC 700915 TaxID=1158606 RepID=R2PU69_9ENTE|nr:dephospho-CoA kinase [Enterococcus asini]EOH88112.1 dephospho-CoA kinase [Enterococcus asini ATCC 700915]EOT55909.1 dephospho-CoA kinase [Enterococcus asini ATCC 700915]OJG12888.1 dephospho-CoA kinase [Enterococcus asini]
MAFILGVTGGIATGKSTVVDVFRKAGVPIVDGDLIAREIVEPGQPALKALVAAFGEEILTEDRLNRKKLGEIVFNDPAKRQLLDRLLDGYLRGAITDQIKDAVKRAPLVVADIPLLYEADYQQYMDQVAVVYIPKELQLTRLMQRDHLTKEAALQRMKSQLSIEEKRQKADFLFDNQGTREETRQQVLRWLAEKGFSQD